LHVGVIAVDSSAKTEPGEEDLASATMGKREDLEDQLLLKNALYPDCPGCKAAYLKNPDAQPPYKQLAIISALTLINGTSSKIYTYLFAPESNLFCLRVVPAYLSDLEMLCMNFRKMDLEAQI
jgi:hypothetical protein